MSTLTIASKWATCAIGILILLAGAVGAAVGGETLATADGRRVAGRLVGDGAGGFRFATEGKGETLPLAEGSAVLFGGNGPEPGRVAPPFRVVLGPGQRLSARLKGLDGEAVRLDDGPGGKPLVIPRAGVSALVQRPGEVLAFQDGFESVDGARWSQVGEPVVAEEPRVEGAKALRLPAGGSGLTCRLAEPVASGRLELAFHDDGRRHADQRWFVDLSFRDPSGEPAPVRVVLGWEADGPAVESPHGPALVVQGLDRKGGWHRLAVRFDADRLDVAVDGIELAHGNGPAGPLVEVRLATEAVGKEPAPASLAAHLDDLRITRRVEAATNVQVEPGSDEVRLLGGDQLFGEVRRADASGVTVLVLGRELTLPWSAASGLYFRRRPAQAAMVEGQLVRVSWRAAPGGDPRDVDQAEGALVAVGDADVTVATPRAGTLAIPRGQLIELRVLNRARRLVLDSNAHHLGNDPGDAEPDRLDPPQPEGRTLEVPFDLAATPPGAATLVLDVVQVEGEEGSDRFADLVKKGELRTNVVANGKPIDSLNRHVRSANKTPERIRIPLPAGALRPGRNVFRFEQAGMADNPDELDDLGILQVALEFDADRPGPAPAPAAAVEGARP
ncbi:MAG TPA: hypothetical protein VG406_17390 [Isosphaeraceae bacterium]|jgi:hypothetical protein|nr:hypothetical protein [Isosphaeraceae bacterium]